MQKNPNKAGGGFRTNQNGLLFEQTTSLNLALINAGFDINQYDVYRNGEFIGRSINKIAFSNVFLQEHGINYLDYNSKRWEPDEAFINELNHTVYIIEKKFQSQGGSVDEKLATFPFKILEYQKLLAPINYNVQYIYLLSSKWFNTPKYQDYYDYMKALGCPYYFDVLPLSALGL
ncbi:MAG: hypothetical protein K2P35_12070 [Lachnospiraceae bacterium]|jgi:hypothetical protein|nr:hypothetical protein [Lachnospiraceae bacterium]